MGRSLVTALALLAAALSGCSSITDDEMVRPSVTETAAPRPPVHLPHLPMARAVLPEGAKVVVTGTVVSAAGRVVDIAPMRMDQHVATTGGIYFVNGGELWFTDLSRIVPTPFHKVRDLGLSKDGKRLSFIDLEHGAKGPGGKPLPVRVAYDAVSGLPLHAEYVTPAG